MPVRTLSKRITPNETRDLIEAAHHASTLGKPLNTFVAINPRLFDDVPVSIADWMQQLLNKVRIYMTRLPVIRGYRRSSRKVGYFLIWARESYAGLDREHLHFVMHCPPAEMRIFEEWLRRQYPGDRQAIYVEKAILGTNRFTRRRQNFGVAYVLKQCTSTAWFAVGRQVRYEKECKHTGAKVAAVLGKRCGTSSTLNQAARDAYRMRPSADPIEAPVGHAASRALEPASRPIPSHTVCSDPRSATRSTTARARIDSRSRRLDCSMRKVRMPARKRSAASGGTG